MTGRLKLSASAAALALMMAVGGNSVQAADYVEPGCTLSGSVMAGYMYNWQDGSASFDADGDVDPEDLEDKDGDADWSTPFGEGAGLVTCGGFNIQADVAYYAHSGDPEFFDGSEGDIDQTNSHIGGVLFYRDPASWAGGLQASWISQATFGRDIDVFRVGLFGEFYFDDMFTLGASAHYYNKDLPFSKDEDGFELAAWGRFYATPDFSLLLRGDALFGDIDGTGPFDDSVDIDGYAITGEAEYLVWDQGLSLFAGARYAERSVDNLFWTFDNDVPIFADVDIEDFQVFAGIKFYFGQGSRLIERQRTGTVDNTSVFHEKLPEFFTSEDATIPPFFIF